MAKKGAAAQLQTDIQTDEELDRFLENPGLCLLDVYTDWCGPCIAMITSLRKAKLEVGGEFLFLATCKCDTIEALSRFRNKSEPTWLFVTRGRALNIVFGAEIPKLLKIIANELHKVTTKTSFPESVPLRELLPIEKERVAKIEAALEKQRIAKEREIRKKRLDYLNYCTGEIINYTAGFGVAIFGPHINRDHLKKVFELGENEKISCKDRRALLLLPEHIEVLHYACNNPISEDALDYMYNKEILACYWKTPDGDKRTVEEIMGTFVNKITKPQPTDDGEGTIPPILLPLEVKVKATKEEEEEEIEPPSEDTVKAVDFILPSEEQEEVSEEDDVQEEGEEVEAASHSRTTIVAQKSSSFLYMASIPAMWTPANRKTTGAAIYTFFRNQTTSFLPPDPVPEPPHLIVVFDAWKRKDVTDVMNKFSDDILTYGYFSNEEPATAQLIANSTAAYARKPANRFDKLIVKVAKRTSHAVLALASHGPTYVSPNTDIGKIEALRFFPENYNNDDVIEEKPPTKPEKVKSKTEVEEKAPSPDENVEAAAAEGGEEAQEGAAEVPAEGAAPAEGAPEAEASPETEATPPPAEEPPAE